MSSDIKIIILKLFQICTDITGMNSFNLTSIYLYSKYLVIFHNFTTKLSLMYMYKIPGVTLTYLWHILHL